ncbi:MAG: type II toxin-antitoxin system VapC family toxin [Terriglobales bacterium]
MDFLSAIDAASARRISAASYVEAAVVIDAAGDPVVSRRLDEFLRDARIAIEPVTEAQARIGRGAYKDFGKASGHPAKLNFSDCFSYALAKEMNEPLLFKGKDFLATDIKSAI